MEMEAEMMSELVFWAWILGEMEIGSERLYELQVVVQCLFEMEMEVEVEV